MLMIQRKQPLFLLGGSFLLILVVSALFLNRRQIMQSVSNNKLILTPGGLSSELSQDQANNQAHNQASNQVSDQTQLTALLKLKDRQLITIHLAQQVLTVEVVNSAASITQGLSGRENIGSDGMLFVFPSQRQATFWMKEMRFNLDLIWLALKPEKLGNTVSTIQVVGIDKNVPAPDPKIPLSTLPRYQSPEAIDLVLEVAAGKTDDWQIHIGEQLILNNT